MDSPSTNYGILGDALQHTGELDSALAAVRESRRLEEQLTETGSTWQRANLVLALMREGSILGEDQGISLDRPQEAAAVFRQALDIADELARKDADDNHHHQLVGEVGWHLGDVLRHADARAALRVYDDCIRTIRGARNANVAIEREEARLLTSSSYVLRALGRESDSKQRLDEAFELLRKTGDYPTAKIELASEADLAERALAEDYAANDQPDKAVETYCDLLTKVNQLNPDPRNDLRDAVYLSNAWEALARILRQDGRIGEATGWETERRRLWEQWDRKMENNSFIRRRLASARVN